MIYQYKQETSYAAWLRGFLLAMMSKKVHISGKKDKKVHHFALWLTIGAIQQYYEKKPQLSVALTIRRGSEGVKTDTSPKLVKSVPA